MAPGDTERVNNLSSAESFRADRADCLVVSALVAMTEQVRLSCDASVLSDQQAVRRACAASQLENRLRDFY